MKVWKEKDKKLSTYIWKADFRCKGKRYRPTAFTKDELLQVVIQIKSNATREAVGLSPKLPPVTLAELLQEHTKDFDLSVEYYRRGKVVLEAFVEHVGTGAIATATGTSDIRAFMRHRRVKNPKLQNSSLNKDLTYISKMFSAAHEYFRELHDFKGPRIPWETESTKRKERVIYVEESEALLAYLRDPQVHKGEKPDSPQIRGDYADMLELALGTAMRWGEVAQLEWSMVNLTAAEVVLPRRITKTDENRTVPLNSRILAILRMRNKSKWTIWVFPRKDGKSYRKYYADRIGSIAKKLGLAFGRDAGFTLHTTRHSAISALQNHGADLATVQQISGHSDKTMALRYSHTNRQRIQDAIESLVPKNTTN